MRKIFLQTIIVLFSLFVSSSCIDDAVGERKSSKDTEKLVSFVVNVAGANPSKTRALTDVDENTVKTVEVLLFDEAGKYTYQPIFSDDIVQKGPNEIAFTMKVPEGTFNMVILANVREKVINILTKLTDGMSKASVLDLLVAENVEKWNVTANSSGYQYMPMAGDIPTITVQGDNTSIKGVMLVRMLSKIDVDTTTDVRKKFNLTSVRLYNNSVKGKIAPDTDSWDAGNGRVVKPSIPADAQNPNLGTALIYQGEEIKKDDNNVGVSCLNTIYTFEAHKGVGDEGVTKNTCLVIGAKYDGDTKDTYYRIDFVSAKSNNKDYIALLRNHQYRVQITDIKGPGFDDPETTLEFRPINIEASVVEWSDGDINDIVFDGQYFLGVSQSEFLFTKEKRSSQSLDNDFYVVTDYPTGWKISKVVDDKDEDITWLKLAATSGGTTKVKTKILLEENESDTGRVGYIYLTAGRLLHVVKVIQSVEEEFYLKTLSKDDEYDIDGLDFVSIEDKEVDQQEYNVMWRPVSSLLYYQINNIDGDGIVWDKSDGLDDIASPDSPIDASNQGYKHYTIRPIQFTQAELKKNPFIVRSQIVMYGISDQGRIISKPFLIRHLAKNIIPKVNDVYDMNGKEQYFYVRSNLAYNISIKEDRDNVLTLITKTGVQDTSEKGAPVAFKLIDDRDYKVRETDVTLLVTSPTDEFEPKEVVINCSSRNRLIVNPSNSYFQGPNGRIILIPVARCNEWQKDGYNGGGGIVKLGDDEEFTAHLVWTDNPKGLGAGSTIKRIEADGRGPKGYLLVEPGAEEGNAVIAIKNKAGKILWSWHIWVTKYSPTGTAKYGEYMDRNLGAFVNEIANLNDKPKAYGLMYQWGRKDPFPASIDIIYNAEGKNITAEKRDIKKVLSNGLSIHNNLQNAVNNPHVFYYNTDSIDAGKDSKDWFSAYKNEMNDKLWKSNEKSLYDPCPEKWRISSADWSKESFDYNGLLHEYSIKSLGKLYIGGFRSYSSASYLDQDSKGYYWTANPGKLNKLVGDSGSISYTDESRATGAMVRCIRYDDRK